MYATREDIEEICIAPTIEDVLKIVFRVMERMPGRILWIAGPLTSGSRSPEENRKRLLRTITHYKERGMTTLNYLPFQRRAMEIVQYEIRSKKPKGIDPQERLRGEFYEPIFKSGKIGELRIMAGSEASLNVMWMRGYASATAQNPPKQRIKVHFIPRELVPKE